MRVLAFKKLKVKFKDDFTRLHFVERQTLNNRSSNRFGRLQNTAHLNFCPSQKIFKKNNNFVQCRVYFVHYILLLKGTRSVVEKPI